MNQDYLKTLKDYCKKQDNSKTLLNYYTFLNKLIQNSKSLKKEDVKEYLENNLVNKKDISKTKSGLKMFCDFYNNNGFDYSIFEEVAKKKPQYKKEKEEIFDAAKTFRRINSIKDKRKKLAYKLMLNAGLRISEVSKLKKCNIRIVDNKILVNIVNSKYGKSRKLYALQDDYLLENLKTVLDELEHEDRLFHGESSLTKQAQKLDFHCHDLRKCYAQIVYFNTADKTSIQKLQYLLGHKENSKTYLKYINREVNFKRTKYDKMKPF